MNRLNRYGLIFVFIIICIGFSDAQIVEIPDSNFKAALLTHSSVIDSNGDGEIQVSEAQSYSGKIDVINKEINDLSGIEAFVNINRLLCSQNSLTSLDVSKNTNLIELSCSYNQLKTLDVTQNTKLLKLGCSVNQLTAIDVSKNPLLSHLYVSLNNITSLDVQNNTKLTDLSCSNNNLTSIELNNNPLLTWLEAVDNQLQAIDISHNPLLWYVRLDMNQIQSIDLSKNEMLEWIDLSYNLLTSIDVRHNSKLDHIIVPDNLLTSLDLSNNPSLVWISAGNNRLFTLNVKNGNNTNVQFFFTKNNPNLSCITVDNVTYSQQNWGNSVDQQTTFNSLCACGIFSIQKTAMNHVLCDKSGKLSVAIDGSDGPYQYQWIHDKNAIDSTITVTESGIYSLKVTNSSGCETVFSYHINAPLYTDSADLNVNMSLNGTTVRPGRVSCFDVTAWNDGCADQSGTVTLDYHGAMTFVSSTLAPISHEANRLIWDFSALHSPNLDFYLEKSLFSNVCFRVDTSALSGRICFDLGADPLLTDANPKNNRKNFCYNIQNGCDPNNKQVFPQGVCQDALTLMDQPLTYTIRFQNTGNASAIDIFILDSLSPHLDLATLRIVNQSHPMVTELFDNRVLKFDFKDINLPDSTSNEKASKGFVTFEISPYPNLLERTVIENKVGIYFDFNPPVITNTTFNTLVSVLPEPKEQAVQASFEDSYVYNGHTYTEPGVYTIYYDGTDGCDSLVILTLDQISGVNEGQNGYIKLYPNPSNGQVEIDFGVVLSEALITIRDAQGRLIRNHGVVNQKKLDINLQEVNNGLYFVQIQDIRGISYILRLMKQ
ncbi:MAG: T9SS type A sorting domain-containing protein [Bacteroidetes bacterium]|nr:MAG: T9SS type A sorting domain-containing protein [Bacteroidota bacterium]